VSLRRVVFSLPSSSVSPRCVLLHYSCAPRVSLWFVPPLVCLLRALFLGCCGFCCCLLDFFSTCFALRGAFRLSRLLFYLGVFFCLLLPRFAGLLHRFVLASGVFVRLSVLLLLAQCVRLLLFCCSCAFSWVRTACSSVCRMTFVLVIIYLSAGYNLVFFALVFLADCLYVVRDSPWFCALWSHVSLASLFTLVSEMTPFTHILL